MELWELVTIAFYCCWSQYTLRAGSVPVPGCAVSGRGQCCCDRFVGSVTMDGRCEAPSAALQGPSFMLVCVSCM